VRIAIPEASVTLMRSRSPTPAPSRSASPI
jgi:hypothetical protein